MSIVGIITNLPLPFLNHWGYWIILFAALFEAMPFGFLIPGHAIVILGGFFAKIGILDIGGVMVVASLGAILGDLSGYLMGRKYGYSFFSRYGKYFLFKKEMLEKTKRLMNEHPGKTLIIGRFNFMTRSFAPFIAGTSEMKFYKFITYNIIGGTSWAVSAVLIGYIFGQSYEIASRYIEGFILLIIALIVLAIYIYRFTVRMRLISK